MCRAHVCGSIEHALVYAKCIFFSFSFVLQIEVSELYFVPDAGASRGQCEAPLFKPVSAYDSQTESLVSWVKFSSHTPLTFYDSFSTISPGKTSFLVSILTEMNKVHDSYKLRYLT